MRTESTRHIYRKCTDIDIDIDIEEHDSKMGAICTQLHDQSNARQCYEDAVNVARSATDSRLPLNRLVSLQGQLPDPCIILHSSTVPKDESAKPLTFA